MKPDSTSSPPPTFSVASAIAGALFGFVAGYIVANQNHIQAQLAGRAVAAAPAAAPAAPSGPAPALVNEQELRTYRDILTRDPKNLAAATTLANLLYDAHRYAEAIPYYQQAFALDRKNVNISTDLGTALWYSGRPDEALAQYAKSLAIDPSHPQTLFNKGIVLLDGKNDPRAAIVSWERLLETSPGDAHVAKARELIAKARSQTGAPAGS